MFEAWTDIKFSQRSGKVREAAFHAWMQTFKNLLVKKTRTQTHSSQGEKVNMFIT